MQDSMAITKNYPPALLNTRPTYYGNILFFFFNDTATTEIYTLSLHDALPICSTDCLRQRRQSGACTHIGKTKRNGNPVRSEEHTSELQSRLHLVCRLLLEKKK